MVLPTDFTIKQEIDNLESNSTEDTPSDLSGPPYDIKLEVDVTGTNLDLGTEWSLKTELFDEEIEDFRYFDEEFENSVEGGVCYEELLDYCVQRCSFCPEKFCESYSLLRHNLNHLKLQLNRVDLLKIVCTICNQHFVDETSLNKHKDSVHCSENGNTKDEDEVFKVTQMLHQCKICGKILSYKSLNTHMKEVHGSEKQYQCTTCKAMFTCRRYLRNHIRCVHNKTSKGKRDVYSNGERDEYPCTQCEVKLRSRYAVTTHIRNCHSEQVQCDICKSVLKSKSYLLAHMRRVHYVDGKEHKCKCGKKFRSARYLRVHQKNTHQKNAHQKNAHQKNAHRAQRKRDSIAIV